MTKWFGSLDGEIWGDECCEIEAYCEDLEVLAEAYAEHVFDCHDGWECGDGFQVWIKSSGGEVVKFDIEIESVPSFTAKRRAT